MRNARKKSGELRTSSYIVTGGLLFLQLAYEETARGGGGGIKDGGPFITPNRKI